MGNALAPPPPPGSNKFAGGLGKRRGASGRVDIFKQSQSSPSLATAAAAPPMIPPPGPMMTPMSIPPQPEETAADQVGVPSVGQTWQISVPHLHIA